MSPHGKVKQRITRQGANVIIMEYVFSSKFPVEHNWCFFMQKFKLPAQEKKQWFTRVDLHTERYQNSLCSMKIRRAHFRHFSSFDSHFSDFEQYKTWKYHCSIKKLAKAIIVRNMIGIESDFSWGNSNFFEPKLKKHVVILIRSWFQ